MYGGSSKKLDFSVGPSVDFRRAFSFTGNTCRSRRRPLLDRAGALSRPGSFSDTSGVSGTIDAVDPTS